MKNIFHLYKKAYLLITVLLILSIAFGQIYYITMADETPSINTDDKCEGRNVYKLCEILLKCSLAFLAGGIINDLKFIKFGHI